MTTMDLSEARKEWVYFLRNSDVFPTTLRGVTTANDVTGTFAGETELLINRTNVRNIRSIVVASVTLDFGADYTYDTDYDDSGTKKCKISFTSAQSGAYTVTYDYGTEKVYPGYPQPQMTISQFPRCGSDFIDTKTVPGGFGRVDKSSNTMTTVFYSKNIKDLYTYVDRLRVAIRAAKTDFYYIGKVVRLIAVGPVIKMPRDRGYDKIFQVNVDTIGEFNYEK